MADIFISYAHEDAVPAATLAGALSGLGWSVWRDDRIGAGQEFDRVLEQQLDLALCVIVMWSAASVNSHWVRAEASTAYEHAKLLPVSLTRNLRLPIQFRQLNAPYLASADLDPRFPEVQALIADIAALTKKRPVGPWAYAADHISRTRSVGARLVTVGQWQLTGRFYGVSATYDLNLRANGRVSGAGKALISRVKLSGNWAFDPAAQVLHLELSGGIEKGMRALEVAIIEWEDDDTAICTFESRPARLRRLSTSA